MKQLVRISLLLFYVFFNAGMSYSLHFCGQEYKRINFYGEAKTCCESTTPMPGCCDDVSHLELPNTDQKQVEAFGLNNTLAALALFPVTNWEYSIPALDSENVDFFADSSPPFVRKQPLYLQHNIFLI